jgi:hypothetical protein
MKHTLAIFGLIFMLNAKATVEEQPKKYSHPSEMEIEKNRACFQDLEVQGCGKFEDDHEQFRSCMSNAHQNLDDHCKELMSNLYGSSN